VRLLLDTCTFLWITASPAAIPPKVLELFRDPENDVFLSAASSWEIVIKHGLGRLPLPDPPERFVPTEREAHGIAPLPIDEESTLHLARLPALHRDPFDRLLVSQAIVHGLTIATPDPLVTQYPARTLWG
jgi:PIN domain nuclease of toxin-antitoxin system